MAKALAILALCCGCNEGGLTPGPANTMKAGEVACGGVTCSVDDYCLVCGAGATPQCKPRSTAVMSCAGTFPVQIFCDGDDDCGPEEKCRVIVGDITVVSCGMAAGCNNFCHSLCESGSSCPPTAPSCESVRFADNTPSTIATKACY